MTRQTFADSLLGIVGSPFIVSQNITANVYRRDIRLPSAKVKPVSCTGIHDPFHRNAGLSHRSTDLHAPVRWCPRIGFAQQEQYRERDSRRGWRPNIILCGAGGRTVVKPVQLAEPLKPVSQRDQWYDARPSFSFADGPDGTV